MEGRDTHQVCNFVQGNTDTNLLTKLGKYFCLGCWSRLSTNVKLKNLNRPFQSLSSIWLTMQYFTIDKDIQFHKLLLIEARASNFKHLLLCINSAVIRLACIRNKFRRAMPTSSKSNKGLSPMLVTIRGGADTLPSTLRLAYS